MNLDIVILAGALHITAPAAPVAEQYRATACALPGQALHWRGWDGWVTPDLCYDRCGTVPGRSNALLAGELSVEDAADLQLTVWRKDGSTWVQMMHCAWFFAQAYCGPWGVP